MLLIKMLMMQLGIYSVLNKMFLLETTFLCKIFVHRDKRYKIGIRREINKVMLVNFL